MLHPRLDRFTCGAPKIVYLEGWQSWREVKGNHPPEAADVQRVLQGNDCCVPLVWKKQPTLAAYSRAGYERKRWKRPVAWIRARPVQSTNRTLDSVTPAASS